MHSSRTHRTIQALLAIVFAALLGGGCTSSDRALPSISTVEPAESRLIDQSAVFPDLEPVVLEETVVR